MMFGIQRYYSFAFIRNESINATIILLIYFYFQNDFVEKNERNIPNGLRLIIKHSTSLFEKSHLVSKSEHVLKTTASVLKNEMDNLVEELEKTVIIFQ